MDRKESKRQQKISGTLTRNQVICARAKTTSLADLGREYNRSRQRIWQIVHRNGRRRSFFMRLIKFLWG